MYEVSRDYIAHHGILGQRWGIRRFQNKDGTLTELGRQRLQEIYKKSKYNEDISEKVLRVTNGVGREEWNSGKAKLDSLLKEQNELSKEATKLFGKVDTDKKNMVTAEIANDFYHGYNKMDMEDIGNAIYMALWEDGGQGYINPYSLYGYKNNLTDKISDIAKRSASSLNTIKDSISQSLNERFDKINSKQLTEYSTLGRAMVDQYYNSKDKNTNELWYLTAYGINAIEIANDKKAKESIEKAEKIANTIYEQLGDRWDLPLLGSALDELNLGGKSPSELTDSDWQRIRTEMGKK